MKRFLTVFSILATMLVAPTFAFATASSVAQTVYTKVLDHGRPVRVMKLVVVSNSSDGTVVDVTVPKIHGFLMKAVTVPSGSPTTLYDITLLDPDASADGLNSVLLNRSTSATEVVYPVGASGAAPLWMAPGDYTLHVANNSVGGAGVTIWLYFVDDPGPRAY